MLNRENLQLVKEQLKIKAKELKKHEEEKVKVGEQMKVALDSKQKKITALKNLLNEKDLALLSAQTQVRNVAPIQARTIATTIKTKVVKVQDPKLLEELNELRKRDNHLSFKVNSVAIEKNRLDKEKSLLLKEIKRLRKDPASTDSLKKQIRKLNRQLQDMKVRSGDSFANLEQMLREKDQIISSYERMLYGEAEVGQEGMLPSEIISELEVELKGQLEEKKKMVIQIEELTELSQDLEMRLSLAKEADSGLGGSGISGRDEESRGAQTAEFSSGLEAFLVTYSDMITLILVIFVLMYSVSKLDEEKLALALSSFQSKEWRVEHLNIRITKKEFIMLERVRELVKDNVDPEMLKRSDTRTIVKRLPNEELFHPGDAVFVEGAGEIIRKAIKDDMRDGVKQIIVEGHTDNVDIKSAKFPSNWELSSARAASVARFIIDKMRFPPKFVVVSGFGEHRPIQKNISDENRALNRRVEIKILKDIKVLEAEEEAKKAKAKAEGREVKETKTPGKPEKTRQRANPLGKASPFAKKDASK